MKPGHVLRLSVTLWVALLSLCLAGCSSDKEKRVPKDLQPIDNPISLDVLWEARPNSGADGQYLFLRPLLTDSMISVIDANGELVVLDRQTGEERFSKDLDEMVTGGLGGDEKSFYYASLNGELVALDFSPEALQNKDGAEREVVVERFRVPLSSESLVPPVVDATHVYVQTIDGKLTAFDRKTGEQIWQYSADEPLLSVRGTGRPVVFESMVLSGFSNGELTALRADNGLELWRVPIAEARGRTELERLVDVDGSPVFEEELLYVAALNGNLKMLESLRGGEYWRKKASSLVSVATGYQSVFVSDADGNILAYDKTTGTQVWKTDSLGFRRLTGPAILSSVLVVGDFEGYIHFLSQSDGSLIGRLRVDSGGVRSPLLVDDGVLYVYGNEGHLVAVRLGE